MYYSGMDGLSADTQLPLSMRVGDIFKPPIAPYKVAPSAMPGIPPIYTQNIPRPPAAPQTAPQTNWADVAKAITAIPAAYLTEEQRRKKEIALAKVAAGQGGQPVVFGGEGSMLPTIGMIIAGVVGIGLVVYLMKK